MDRLTTKIRRINATYFDAEKCKRINDLLYGNRVVVDARDNVTGSSCADTRSDADSESADIVESRIERDSTTRDVGRGLVEKSECDRNEVNCHFFCSRS